MLPQWKIPAPWLYIQDMRRDEVIAKLKEAEPALRGFGVAALYLFGSHARDEAEAGSDVDVFVDPAPDRDFGFLPFMDAYETIKPSRRRSATSVEIGGKDCSYPHRFVAFILGDVEREAVRIFLMACQQEPPRPSASYSR